MTSLRTRFLLTVVAAGLAGATVMLLTAAWRLGGSQGYSPEQPIAFSHRLHAGDNQIPCLYCHYGAETSRHAGIPAMNVCLNCHRQLQVASAEVQKLKEAVEQGRAIRWIKVHNLPDYVYFNHSQHVTSGIACQQCHGPVETMTRVYQAAPLRMGWCLDCHRSRGVTPPSQRGFAPVRAGTMKAIGGTDCSKCHY